jgi:hypothetical protein
MAKKKVEHKCPKCGSTDHQRCIEVSTPNHAYCDNKVITSKYTWWNFAFKNVYEQFQRKANLYFLVISILQVGALCFMGLCDLSPTSPYATIGPLVVIMTVSAVKQAIVRTFLPPVAQRRPYSIALPIQLPMQFAWPGEFCS